MQRFSVQERRLFAFCLQHYDSRPGVKNARKFNVSVDTFKRAFPEFKNYYPKQIFDVIKTAAKGIQLQPYEYFNRTSGDYVAHFWFSSLRVNQDDLIIEFSLTEEILPFFTNIQNHFIKYYMKDIERLNSPSAWDLYEYLKEMYLNGKCTTWTETIENLRSRLRRTNTYNRFGDFENYCIKRPIAEINEHTDLMVDYKKKKKGVKIDAIIFYVKNKASDPDAIDIEDLSKLFESEQRRYGISAAIAKRNTEQAEKINKLSEAIKKIESAHKSWKKYGKGPFSAYIASTLTKFLFQQDLFESEKQTKKKEAHDELRTYSNRSLALMAGSGNIAAEKILRERASRDAEALEMILKLQEQSSTTPGL
jgi:plasmid replication initiation protein